MEAPGTYGPFWVKDDDTRSTTGAETELPIIDRSGDEGRICRCLGRFDVNVP